MKYYIDYEQTTGKILGYLTDATVKQKQGQVIEVDFFKYNEVMAFDKIIIDGKNITFEKVDWRTEEEIRKEENNTQIAEAKAYLSSTGWIWEKYNRNVLVLKDMTSEEFNLKYTDIITKQEECRALINELEVQLEATNG